MGCDLSAGLRCKFRNDTWSQAWWFPHYTGHVLWKWKPRTGTWHFHTHSDIMWQWILLCMGFAARPRPCAPLANAVIVLRHWAMARVCTSMVLISKGVWAALASLMGLLIHIHFRLDLIEVEARLVVDLVADVAQLAEHCLVVWVVAMVLGHVCLEGLQSLSWLVARHAKSPLCKHQTNMDSGQESNVVAQTL